MTGLRNTYNLFKLQHILVIVNIYVQTLTSTLESSQTLIKAVFRALAYLTLLKYSSALLSITPQCILRNALWLIMPLK